jgi:hypothetical protein
MHLELNTLKILTLYTIVYPYHLIIDINHLAKFIGGLDAQKLGQILTDFFGGRRCPGRCLDFTALISIVPPQ